MRAHDFGGCQTSAACLLKLLAMKLLLKMIFYRLLKMVKMLLLRTIFGSDLEHHFCY